MSSSKWLLLLVSAGCFELALLSLLRYSHHEIMYVSAGLIGLLGALSSFFWVRFPVIILWAASLAYDFRERRNFFAVFFILIALFQVYHFLKSLFRKTDQHPPAL